MGESLGAGNVALRVKVLSSPTHTGCIVDIVLLLGNGEISLASDGSTPGRRLDWTYVMPPAAWHLDQSLMLMGACDLCVDVPETLLRRRRWCTENTEKPEIDIVPATLAPSSSP